MQHTVKTVDGSLGFLTVGTTSSYSKWFYLMGIGGQVPAIGSRRMRGGCLQAGPRPGERV